MATSNLIENLTVTQLANIKSPDAIDAQVATTYEEIPPVPTPNSHLWVYVVALAIIAAIIVWLLFFKK